LATRLEYSGIKYLNSLKNSKKPGLKSLMDTLSLLNSPQKLLKKNIIISGTNGKGTVAQILNKIYVDAGYNVGLYTSPHLVKINERIKINNRSIRTDTLDRVLKKIIKVIQETSISLSYFELLTAASILHFSNSQNDINIFEVGLGGRYDATNVIKAKIGILTNVEMDHMEYLGETLEEIAYEKVGIINLNSILVTSVKTRSMKILNNYCKESMTKILRLGNHFTVKYCNKSYKYSSPNYKLNFKSSLRGQHQLSNLGVSLKAVEEVGKLYKLKVSKKNIISSLKNVTNPGRYEILNEKPLLVIDVSHNVHSIKTLISNFKIHYPRKKIYIILGMLNEKNPQQCISLLLSIAKKIYLTDVPNPRSFKPKNLIKTLDNKKISYLPNDKIPELINKKKDLIITGSIYLLGSLISSKYVKLK